MSGSCPDTSGCTVSIIGISNSPLILIVKFPVRNSPHRSHKEAPVQLPQQPRRMHHIAVAAPAQSDTIVQVIRELRVNHFDLDVMRLTEQTVDIILTDPTVTRNMQEVARRAGPVLPG